MNQYIEETALAVKGILGLVGDDEAILVAKLGEREITVKGLARARSILHIGAPTTGFGEDSTPYFEKMARDARREASLLNHTIAELEAAIAAKEASVQALSSAILQIAKQGIAIVRGDIAKCPPGRQIGRESLSNVVWQARNQSQHWEENSFRPHVMACFENLRAGFGDEYRIPSPSPKSLAKEVVQLLGWADYTAYEKDMVSLLG